MPHRSATGSGTTTTASMLRTGKWSAQEEEQLINFVGEHEVLYVMRHRQYLDQKLREKLWLQLAEKLHRDLNEVRQKWQSMRDSFIRTQYHGRKDTNNNNVTNGEWTSTRDKMMHFLIDASVVNRRTKAPTTRKSSTTTGRHASHHHHHHHHQPASSLPDAYSYDGGSNVGDNQFSTFFYDYDAGDHPQQQPQQHHQQQQQRVDTSSDAPAKAATSAPTLLVGHRSSADLFAETNHLLHQMLGRMPVAASTTESTATAASVVATPTTTTSMTTASVVGTVDETSSRHVRTFFAAMADTVSRLPSKTIARLKIDIARVVGEAELSCMRSNNG